MEQVRVPRNHVEFCRVPAGRREAALLTDRFYLQVELQQQNWTLKRTLHLLITEFVSVVSRAIGDGLRSSTGSGRTVFESQQRRRQRRWFICLDARSPTPTHTQPWTFKRIDVQRAPRTPASSRSEDDYQVQDGGGE